MLGQKNNKTSFWFSFFQKKEIKSKETSFWFSSSQKKKNEKSSWFDFLKKQKEQKKNYYFKQFDNFFLNIIVLHLSSINIINFYLYQDFLNIFLFFSLFFSYFKIKDNYNICILPLFFLVKIFNKYYNKYLIPFFLFLIFFYFKHIFKFL